MKTQITDEQLNDPALQRAQTYTPTEPIRVGDKFKVGSTVFEVIGTKPGGKIELFDRQKTRFTDRYHREVKHWERVK